MGRPEVSLQELVDADLDLAVPLSPGELATYCDFDLDSSCFGNVTPCSKVWPMGFGWSSYVAQSFMVDSVLSAGYSKDQILAEEWSLPTLYGPAITIATDDVILFQQASVEELAADPVPPLGALDAAWSAAGVQAQTAKSFNNVSSCIGLGVSLIDGTCLAPRPDRLGALPDAAADLLTRGKCTPKQLSSFIGILQWWNLLNRPLFSCLGAVYPFCQVADDLTEIQLWPQVASEVALNVCLVAFWAVGLTARWMPQIAATDASPSFGYGMALASIAPLELRAAAAEAYGPDSLFRQTPTAREAELEKPRKGRLYRLPLQTRHFKRVFSVRAHTVSHSGAMEADAAALGLARLARRPRLHASRGMLLVDAKVVEAALRKGRSSAPTLRRPIARASGILLAAGFRMRYGYIPSESNIVADGASRGDRPFGRTRRNALRATTCRLDRIVEHGRVVDSIAFGDGLPHASSIAGHLSCLSSFSDTSSRSSLGSGSL